MSSLEEKNISIEKGLEMITKKKKAYLIHVIIGILAWLIVQSFWILYWTLDCVRAFNDMSLLLSFLCFITLAIPILIVAITHRKYTALSGYEFIFKQIYKYSNKKEEEKIDHKEEDI